MMSEEEFEAYAQDYDTLGIIPFMDRQPSEAPLNYCGGWLRKGSVTQIYSRAGVGKTLYMTGLVEALLTGISTEAFPVTGVRPRKVLWINGDLPEWQVDLRLRDLKRPEVDYLSIKNADLAEKFYDLSLSAKNYDLICMDNRGTLFDTSDPADHKFAKEITMRLRDLTVNPTGTAVIMAAHAGKNMEGASSFGSSAQEWQLDTIIELSRPSKYQWQQTKGAYSQYQHYAYEKVVEINFNKCRLCETPAGEIFHIAKLEDGPKLEKAHPEKPE